jgi:hypothetical protein
MRKLNQGQRAIHDPVDVKRTAYVVETSDVGKTQSNYLGQMPYTFLEDDVGRLVEVITGFTPGFMSWGFGSKFAELRNEYPDPKPYVVEA